MAQIRLSNSSVEAAEPSDRDAFLWDDRLRGFGLKVTPRGAKTYVLQYRTGGRGTPTKRYTIGSHGSPWTPHTARVEAERLLILVKQGKDPHEDARQQKRDRVDLRFEVYAERYLSHYGKRWSSRTRPTVESNFRNWIVPALKGRSISEIGKPDIVAMLDRVEERAPGRLALPRNVYAHARKLFSWARSRGDIDHHPFEGIDPPPAPSSRERVLSDHELAAIWRTSEKLGPPFGPMLRLLIITGQRREEVAGLDWQELDPSTGNWAIPAARAKNRKTHTVPLSNLAIRELKALARGDWPRRGLVFTTTGQTAASGHSRAKERLDRLLEKDFPAIQPWRVHDLRRTFATGLQRLGVRLEVTEACLNHVSGSRRGVVGVYQRHQWSDEKRQALDLWGQHLTVIQACLDLRTAGKLLQDIAKSCARLCSAEARSDHQGATL